jgi:hypothetical protein
MTIMNIIKLVERTLDVKVAMNVNRKSSPAKTARYCAIVIMYEEGFTHHRISKYFKVHRSVITKTIAEADRLIQFDKAFKEAYLDCIGAVTKKYDVLPEDIEDSGICSTCNYKVTKYSNSPELTPYRVTTTAILLNTTSKVFGVPVYEITGRKRTEIICAARHMAVFIIHKYHPELTLQQIGEIMRGKHHASIINSLKAAETLMVTEWTFKTKYQILIKKLKQNDATTFATAS